MNDKMEKLKKLLAEASALASEIKNETELGTVANRLDEIKEGAYDLMTDVQDLIDMG
jgi:hypothetical protein